MPESFYSMSDIKDYVNYIIKKQEMLPTNHPIHIYINQLDNILTFKIKDGYKLELQTPETIKFVSRLQVVDIVLV